MSMLYRKSFLFVAFIFLGLLTACGSQPVKPLLVKAPVAVEKPVVVVPVEKPVAQTMAIGLRRNDFAIERMVLPVVKQPPVMERIEFDPNQFMQLAALDAQPNQHSQPADAPEGMGKAPTNVEALKKRMAEHAANRQSGVNTTNKVDVERKLNFARMMLMTKTGRRIAESDNGEAKLILKDVSNKLDRADAQLKAGNALQANSVLGEAMRLFNLAGRMVPSESLKLKQKNQFPDLQQEIVVAKDLHKRNYDKLTAKLGMAAGINYDMDKVAALEQQAEALALVGDYAAANKALIMARNRIQSTIQQMMTGRKIVYELNLDTPEDEYKYELNKYIGYEELIPIAIEQKKPSKGVLMLSNRHVKEAKRMAGSAAEKAQTAEYPQAIRMLQDATSEIRKALKLMGVPNIG